ncbi:hypothetical protein PAEAM_23790 [Paenibacillus sp. GM1FR]|nr:hypothetical protein PAEAM_23790 [Paenibacillus sp. GM1FR]
MLCSSEMVVFLLSILTYDVQQYGGLFFAVTFIIASDTDSSKVKLFEAATYFPAEAKGVEVIGFRIFFILELTSAPCVITIFCGILYEGSLS